MATETLMAPTTAINDPQSYSLASSVIDDRLHQQNRKIMNPEAAKNRHESTKNNDLTVSDDCFSQITKNEKANHLEYLKNFR